MNPQIEKRIDEILEKMTLRDKIGQLTQISCNVNDYDAMAEKIKKYRPGSLILAGTAFAGSDEQERMKTQVLNDLQKLALDEFGIPMVNGRDVIHGFNVLFPTPLAMAAAFDGDLVKNAFRATAEEATASGVHWTFTPMLDVARDSRWGRMVEGPGEDPYVGECFARASVEGLQGDLTRDDQMIACAKHYIGYGASEGGRDYHTTEINNYSLHNYYLRAFRAAVKAGIKTFMSSFNEIGGQPVSGSRYLLTDVLRGELGFEGFVVSDWAAIDQLRKHGVAATQKDAARIALNAGLDMDMVDDCYFNSLEELVENGELSMETVDLSVRRILRVKAEMGLFDRPYIRERKPDIDAHMALARKTAADCMVLLKNNGVLPIAEGKKIGLAGPMKEEVRAHIGTWAPDCVTAYGKNLYSAFCDKFGKERVVNKPMDAMRADLFRHSDVVVLALGESEHLSGEAHSIANTDLPADQLALAKQMKMMGKPVVGVMCFARPVALGEAEMYFDAILYAWHGGTCAADAIADVLAGDVNPSGRLPVTIPRSTHQIPLYYNVRPAGRYVDGYYGDTWGNYQDMLPSPLYPFGYGLSYTTFAYGKAEADVQELSLEEIMAGKSFRVSVTVENTGKREGKEVVQCYINDNVASMVRPIRELRGFNKVTLSSGEKKTVTFAIGFEELAFYNAENKLVVEKGTFTVAVGANCYTGNAVTVEVK